MLKDFYYTYFSVNLKDYPNIGVDFQINKFLFLFFLVLCVGVFVLNYDRTCTVTMIKQLIRHEATSEENAKTLDELGLGGHRGIKRSLMPSGRLFKIVSRLGYIRPTYEEYSRYTKQQKKELDKIDFESAAFYISEDQLPFAKRIFNTYNPSVLRAILSCIFIIIIYICLLFCMPEILQVVNSVLN